MRGVGRMVWGGGLYAGGCVEEGVGRRVWGGACGDEGALGFYLGEIQISLSSKQELDYISQPPLQLGVTT